MEITLTVTPKGAASEEEMRQELLRYFAGDGRAVAPTDGQHGRLTVELSSCVVTVVINGSLSPMREGIW